MRKPEIEFEPFNKIPRLRRDIVVTEKLDGTNSTIFINFDGEIFAASRNRWITPEDDNYGFARWVEGNKNELLKLGPGQYRGEWWGQKIQRGYSQFAKWFSLFNTARFCLYGKTPITTVNPNPTIPPFTQIVLPENVGLVPVLYSGVFDEIAINGCLRKLRSEGSVAAPGYMNPEGVVVFHTAANHFYKVTLENDEQPKGTK